MKLQTLHHAGDHLAEEVATGTPVYLICDGCSIVKRDILPPQYASFSELPFYQLIDLLHASHHAHPLALHVLEGEPLLNGPWLVQLMPDSPLLEWYLRFPEAHCGILMWGNLEIESALRVCKRAWRGGAAGSEKTVFSFYRPMHIRGWLEAATEKDLAIGLPGFRGLMTPRVPKFQEGDVQESSSMWLAASWSGTPYQKSKVEGVPWPLSKDVRFAIQEHQFDYMVGAIVRQLQASPLSAEQSQALWECAKKAQRLGLEAISGLRNWLELNLSWGCHFESDIRMPSSVRTIAADSGRPFTERVNAWHRLLTSGAASALSGPLSQRL